MCHEPYQPGPLWFWLGQVGIKSFLMKALLVYDLDGTLVDTAADIVHSANHMRKSMGFTELPPSEISGYVGKGLHHLISACLKTEDIKTLEKGAQMYRDYYSEHMMDHSVLYPGTLEFLTHFQNKIQVVLTNKPNPYSAQMLETLGVGSFFQEIIAGNSGFPYKPDPKSIQYLLKKHGLKKTAVAMIGDSTIDVELGHNAGIETFVLSHGFSHEAALKQTRPAGIFHHFKELYDFACKEGW